MGLRAACEEQLALLKRDFFPSLAREHGLQADFASACKVRASCCETICAGMIIG